MRVSFRVSITFGFMKVSKCATEAAMRVGTWVAAAGSFTGSGRVSISDLPVPL